MDRHFGQQPQSVRDAVSGAGQPLWPVAVDDDTTAYIIQSRPDFENLRQVAAQLAGLLVLNAAGAESAGPHHPMLATAEQLYRETVENLRRERATPRARRHHDCLLQAAASLGASLAAAHQGLAVDPVLIPLRAAYAQLQSASRELPGFAMVSFEQGCCGRHA